MLLLPPLDMHMHSWFSDGDKSAGELLASADQQGLTAVSITDHDTVDAYFDKDTVSKIKATQALVIPGVEILIHHNGGLFEMMGYGFDPKLIDKDLTHLTAPQFWAFVAFKFVEKLKDLGIKNPASELGLTDADMKKPDFVYKKLMQQYPHFLEKFNPDFNKGYPHLRRKGFYNPNSPLHLDLREILTDSKKSIEIIKDAKGSASLAHYGEYDPQSAYTLLQDLGDQLDGVELFHPANTSPDTKEVLGNYLRNNPEKIYTGGSDYHGSVKGQLGKPAVPDKVLENLLKQNPGCMIL